MKRLLFLLTMCIGFLAGNAQFSDSAKLNKYIRDTIRDRRPDKVTAADIQKAFLGVSSRISEKMEGVLQRGDSVFVVKEGKETFVYKQSGGGLINDTTANDAAFMQYAIRNGRKGFYVDSSNVFSNVAELMSSERYKRKFKIAYTSGFYAEGDGGGAAYRWVDTSTKAPDTAFIIAPSGYNIANPGRWELLIQGDRLNIRQIGGRANASKDGIPSGATTDHIPIMAKLYAFNKAYPGKIKKVYFPHAPHPFGYYFSRKLQVRQQLTFEGDEAGSLEPSSALIFYGTPGVEHLGHNAPGGGHDEFTIKNLLVYNIVTELYQPDGYQYGVFSNGHLTAENVIVRNFRGDGWRIEACGAGQLDPDGNGYSTNADAFTVTNCGAWFNAGNGLTIKGCDANGGLVRRFIATSNKYWGLLDSSSFATLIDGAMFHNNGVYGYTAAYSFPKSYVRVAKGDGTYYAYMARKDNINVAPVPGASSDAWTYFGTNAGGTALGYDTAVYTLWNASVQYRGAGAYRLDQASSVMLNTYTENGQGHAIVAGTAISIGGQQDTKPVGTSLYGHISGAVNAPNGYIGPTFRLGSGANFTEDANGAASIQVTNPNQTLTFINNQGNVDIQQNFQVQHRFFANGNVGLGQSVDQGYRLDVIGTSRHYGQMYYANFGQTLGLDTTGYKLLVRNTSNNQVKEMFWPVGGSGGGGGATPGGASGAIQYNNAGAFGGFGSWDGSRATIPYLTVDATAGGSANGLQLNYAGDGFPFQINRSSSGTVGGFGFSTGGTADFIFGQQYGGSKLRIYAYGFGSDVLTIDKTTGGTTFAGDVELTDATKGIILKSPNGTRYRVTVSDAGALTTTVVN